MNKDYPAVANIPADELKALIAAAWADNMKHLAAINTNNMLVSMAEHRLIGLALQEAEVE